MQGVSHRNSAYSQLKFSECACGTWRDALIHLSVLPRLDSLVQLDQSQLPRRAAGEQGRGVFRRVGVQKGRDKDGNVKYMFLVSLAILCASTLGTALCCPFQTATGPRTLARRQWRP